MSTNYLSTALSRATSDSATTFSTEKQEAFCQEVALGIPFTDVCMHVGVSIDLVREWLATGESSFQAALDPSTDHDAHIISCRTFYIAYCTARRDLAIAAHTAIKASNANHIEWLIDVSTNDRYPVVQQPAAKPKKRKASPVSAAPVTTSPEWAPHPSSETPVTQQNTTTSPLLTSITNELTTLREKLATDE